MRPTVCSLFAGIGGIDIGFQQAGFDIIWANEYDSAACRTYRKNFGDSCLVEGDVRDISASSIPNFDVLTAGFPCQPFSIAGRQKGFEDSAIYRPTDTEVRWTKNQMCPTLTANMGTYPDRVPVVRDDYGIRKLTLRECLDFQGFPKEYYFPNTITIDDAYKQVGNSVCIPVIRRIAEQIKELV